MWNLLTQPLPIFLTGVAVGFILGVSAHHYLCKHQGKRLTGKEFAAWIIVVLLSGLYTASIVADIGDAGYQTPLALHGLMGLGVGYVLEAKVSDVIAAVWGNKK